MEEMEAIEIMDLATFLEFAIQATHCLEMLHRNNIIHREVRANAFHLNHHSGLVRLVHFGNRAVSLEEFGVPSEYVLNANSFDEPEKLRIKEALSYFAPEQTGSIENFTEDYRTDLYSLGIMFWTLLVGPASRCTPFSIFSEYASIVGTLIICTKKTWSTGPRVLGIP